MSGSRRLSSGFALWSVLLVGWVSGCGSGEGNGDVAAPEDPTPAVLDEVWSTEIPQAYGGLVVADEVAYLLVGEEPVVEVAAVSLADGELRWSKRLTDSGASGFSLGPTDVGVMVPYSDEAGDHLVLLDEDDGSVAWDTETEYSLYDNFGQWGPGVGIVMPGEHSYAAVDLADGTMVRLEDDEYWGFLADEFVRISGSRIEQGVDPFGDTQASGTIELPVAPDEIIESGELLVLIAGDEVIGFVEGSERWRIATPFIPDLVVQASDRHLVLETEGQLQVIRFDAASAELLPQPAGLLDPKGDAEVDDRAYLFGIVGTGLGSVGPETVRQAQLLELGDDRVTDVGSFSFTGWDEPWVVGHYVLSYDDEGLVARTLPELGDAGPTPAITVADDDDLETETTGDGALLVLDTGRGLLQLYR